MKYKVGDRVKYGSEICTVTKVLESQGKFKYRLQSDTWFDIVNEDEMIEGLVEEEIKPEPKFHISDWATDGDVLAEDSCIFIIQKLGDNSTAAKTYCTLYDDGDFDNGTILYFDIDSTRPATKEEKQKLFKAIKDNGYKWNPETKTLEKLIEPKFREYSDNEPLDVPTMTSEFVKEHGLPCPDGYIFKDENGNVIDATKIVLEKKGKEYPKTYEGCCKVLEIEGYSLLINTKHITDYERDLGNLMGQLHRLIICRDAYWKIAGEEMSLGKPWEPSGNEDCFIISRSFGEVFLFESAGDSETFEFPTREMRDAFYENFKELINECKELL